MSAGFGGSSVIHGAVRTGGNIVSWFAGNILSGIIIVVLGFGVTVHLLPYLFFMAVYHDNLQKGVDKATNVVVFSYHVIGAGWGSKDVGTAAFDEGVTMSHKSLPKANG